jgi:hypothetical protein
MKIKVINYEHKSKEVEISDETRGVSVSVISGDEVITVIGDGEILDRVDAADEFGNPRIVGYPDGSYGVRVGTEEWCKWLNRPNDSYYWFMHEN